MKKKRKGKRDADTLDNYDFSKGVRGKYAQRYAQSKNMVVLAPEALRALVQFVRKSGQR